VTETRARSSRKSEPRSAWFTYGLFALAAVLFGALVLPRIGRSLESKPAPDFALPVLSGGEPGARVRLSEQRGKLVLLDFWASWCGPCRAQTKVLQAISATPAGKELVVLGINVSDNPEAAQRYLEAVKPPWLVLADVDGVANEAYRVEALPTLVAIDRAGRIFAVRRHFVSERELSALLAAMSGS
jgi:thiol-disulfide isomerase/thioredoxin